MLQVYKKLNKSIVSVDAEMVTDNYDFAEQWVHMCNPTDKEIELVSRLTAIPDDVIKAALDEEERPRIEKEDNYTLVLTDIPFTEEGDDHYTYSTLPFAFISNDSTVVTVCLADTSIVNDLLSGRIKDFNIHKTKRFLLQLEMAIAKKYLQYLTQIDRTNQRVQTQLEKSMKNDDLIEMLDLEKSLVYFTTSLRSNAIVLEKIPKVAKLFEEDDDLWEDVVIENRQAIEMSNIYREILNSTMDAYGSIINNNMNRIMKILTSLTLLVAVPSMIGAFWGMNVGGIPFGTANWGFWAMIAISFAIVGILAFILWKKNMLK